MYPILFDPARVRAVVVGRGVGAVRRVTGLEAAGVTDFNVFVPGADAELAAVAGARLRPGLPERPDLEAANMILVAGLEDRVAEGIARAARELGVAINVEDRTQWCDFHLPATVRRGDLLLTASTGGRSPGLARALRRHLEGLFGPEWEGRLDALAKAREAWRAEGSDPSELSKRTQEWIDREGWFG
ncbi:MAG: siroheme synthase [Alphaproteobacteria bacterium]|nr:siroheme synthase [Alphaproteobacteria bacterium]